MDLIQKGFRARWEGRLGDAHRDFSEALALATEYLNRARALTGLGQIERDLGNTDRAKELYSQAVSIYRRAGDVQKLAHTIRHVADMDRGLGNLSAAEPAYQEALALYREDPATSALDLANTLNGFADLLTTQGAREKARQLTEEACGLYTSQAHVPGVDAGVQECTERLLKLSRNYSDR